MKIMPVIIGMLVAWVMVVCTQSAIAENLVERTVAISGVSKLQVQGDADLEISIGDLPMLIITSPQSFLNNVVVDANNDTLRLRNKGKKGWNTKSLIKYRLTITSLDSLEVQGAMNINIASPINVESFDLKVNGDSTVKMAALNVIGDIEAELTGGSEITVSSISAERFFLKANGAAELNLTGTVKHQDLKLNGAAQYHGFQLQSETAVVRAKGASEVDMWVSQSLDLHLIGASEVSFYGDAKVTSKINGASEVHRKGLHP